MITLVLTINRFISFIHADVTFFPVFICHEGHNCSLWTSVLSVFRKLFKNDYKNLTRESQYGFNHLPKCPFFTHNEELP